jgi:hypothetical protein
LTLEGIQKLRPILDTFPNSDILVSFFASFNNVGFLVELYRRRLQTLVDLLVKNSVTMESVQEIAEELGDLLGRAIETKIVLENTIRRIEALE